MRRVAAFARPIKRIAMKTAEIILRFAQRLFSELAGCVDRPMRAMRMFAFSRSIAGTIMGFLRRWARFVAVFLIFSLPLASPFAHAADSGLSGDDRAAGPFPIGFAFNYYGVDYTQFYITTNGLIQFVNPTTSYSNVCLTGEQFPQTIYVFWDDLRVDVYGQPPGKIQYRTIGQAPHRQLVAQWTNMYFYGSNLPMGTFQAILSEGTNEIKLQYRYLSDARSRGDSATVGAQGAQGRFVSVGCNRAGMLRQGQAISLTPGANGEYAVNEEADYSFEDISGLTPAAPTPSAAFTNAAPSWRWQKIPSLNAYEIQAQNLRGDVLRDEAVGDVDSYVYSDGAVDGESYVARVRGSVNNGGTWEIWSDLSSATTVDLSPPTARVERVTQKNGVDFQVDYAAQDSLSGLRRVHMRAAGDAAFENAFFDEDLTFPLSGTQDVKIPPGVSSLYVSLSAFDAAGNESAASEPFLFRVLPRPVITSPVSGAALDRPIMTVEGIAYPGSDVAVRVNGEQVGVGAADADGKFRIDGAPTGSEGANTLDVVSMLNGSRSEPSEAVEFLLKPADGPVVTVNYAGSPLEPGAAIGQPGTLSIRAESRAGISRIEGSIDGANAFGETYAGIAPVFFERFFDFAQLPNGGHVLSVVVADGDGGQTALSIPFTLGLSAPAAPVITEPKEGARVSVPRLSVAGSAAPGSQAQIFVNGRAAGDPVAVDSSGNFAGSVAPVEGSVTLTARARNSRGESPLSGAVGVFYDAAAPSVSISAPAEGAEIASDVLVEANAVDSSGVAKVELFANDSLFASLASPPFSAKWNAGGLPDGRYVLRAAATNAAGKTAWAERSVTVQKSLPSPSAPSLPYFARNVTVSPAVSFGDAPIRIAGEVAGAADGKPAANAALRLILRAQGFERSVNLVGDADGRFAYDFRPQANDMGAYDVFLAHPADDAYGTRPAQGHFVIDRLSADYSQFELKAIRGVESAVPLLVRAGPGGGATGARWRALPADQPSGGLPPGITLDLGQPIDIAAGAAAPVAIKLLAGADAGERGSVILKLFANESGSTPRAELRLDYKLSEAGPALAPDPPALEIGVRQTKAASGKINIVNKGYGPARNVRVELLAPDAGALPPWVSLVSDPGVGAIDVGQSALIQVDARPGAGVSDGYSRFRLKIAADNEPDVVVPVTVAVARDGQGAVRFKMADIYTNTPDDRGLPIEGLAGARVALQNEALAGDIRVAVSDAQGVAEFPSLPPGDYRWRASAPDHFDASGRITVNAGLTAKERVFLDYRVVGVEFSVSETTVRDVYDIVLEATYRTQVPAPVVLFEPLSVNLSAMSPGETLTGELTLSNYGLVRADDLRFSLPQSDERFKYEFFGALPTRLPAKSRVAIPYRITALKPPPINDEANAPPPVAPRERQGAGGAAEQSVNAAFAGKSAADKALKAGEAGNASGCFSYLRRACSVYAYQCAAGDMRFGTACSDVSQIVGSKCVGAPGVGIGIGGSGGGSGVGGGGGWGGWGGAAASGGASIPLAPTCADNCDGPLCRCEKRP